MTLSRFSEYVVAALLGGELASSRVQKGYDLIDTAGRRVQVRYLANPADRWVNEHLVTFVGDIDAYALVLFENLAPSGSVVFPRSTLRTLRTRADVASGGHGGPSDDPHGASVALYMCAHRLQGSPKTCDPRRSDRPSRLRADGTVTRAAQHTQVDSIVSATHRARQEVIGCQVIDSTASLALSMQGTHGPTRRLPGSPIPALGSGLTVTLAATTLDSGMGTAWLQARCQRESGHQVAAPGSTRSSPKTRRASVTTSSPSARFDHERAHLRIVRRVGPGRR